MKKQFIGVSMAVLVITAVSITAFIPPQNDKKNNKEQPQNQGKGNQGKGNQGKANQGQGNQGQGNQGQGNQGDKNDRGNSGNKGKDGEVGDIDEGRNNKNKEVRIKDNGVYIWDRETFRDRKKYKSQDKVTLCHKTNKSGDPGVTITVSSNALKAHMNHGDVMGTCPTVNDNRFSDIFMRRRVEYYNSLQNGQEQVLYSQSVLDYALARLVESRLQLNQYQASGMPAADIERKQATIVVLEQNTSLLEKLVTAAAVLVADKF